MNILIISGSDGKVMLMHSNDERPRARFKMIMADSCEMAERFLFTPYARSYDEGYPDMIFFDESSEEPACWLLLMKMKRSAELKNIPMVLFSSVAGSTIKEQTMLHVKGKHKDIPATLLQWMQGRNKTAIAVN